MRAAHAQTVQLATIPENTLFVLVFSNIHDKMLNLGFSLAERRKHLKYVSLCGLDVNIFHFFNGVGEINFLMIF